MPAYDFRVQHGPALLGITHRRLCEPMRGQNLRFKHGPMEYWLKVVAIEPQPNANTIVRLAPEGLSAEYLKSAKWKEIAE